MLVTQHPMLMLQQQKYVDDNVGSSSSSLTIDSNINLKDTYDRRNGKK